MIDQYFLVSSIEFFDQIEALLIAVDIVCSVVVLVEFCSELYADDLLLSLFAGDDVGLLIFDVVKSAVAFGFGGEGCFGCEVDGSIGRVL